MKNKKEKQKQIAKIKNKKLKTKKLQNNKQVVKYN